MDQDDETNSENTSDVCLLLLLALHQLNKHLIWICVTNVQVIVLSHGEHTYYGYSDLENLDDEVKEERDVLEVSKSECKSDVSFFLFYCNA
jgi:hypothetical protein